MSIIVEGPDGAGKTTLIEQLKGAIPELMELPRFCTSTGGPLPDLFAAVQDRLWQLTTPHAILDRHPLWSEYVYQQALGREMIVEFYDGSATRAHNVLDEHALVIVCLPPIEVVRERLRAEEQLSGVEYAIDDIYERYLTRAAQFTGFKFIYQDPGQFDEVASVVRAHMLIRARANEEEQ
ncbi:thymidylate kinase [Gordonia phage Orla]|nr:thymidylate kinase [Gordonia phage Orla]